MINGKYSYRIHLKDASEVRRFEDFLKRHHALLAALEHVELKPRLYEVSFDLEVRYLELVGYCSHVFYPAKCEFVDDLNGFIAYYEGENKSSSRKEELVGLVIAKDETAKLLQICKRYAIPTPYPDIFEDGKFHPLWAISNKGIGLVGTEVMRRLRKVLHGLDELDAYLSSLGNGPTPSYLAQGNPIFIRAESKEQLNSFIALLRREHDFRPDESAQESERLVSNKRPCIYVNVEGHSYGAMKEGARDLCPAFNRYISPEDFLALISVLYQSEKIDKSKPVTIIL